MPTATAGLNAPPEMLPTENAPTSTVNPMASPCRHLQILEQNYRNDPVSQQLLLSLYEGKTIDFLETDKDGTERTVQAKIIRSGYVPHSAAFQAYGPEYAAQQAAVAQGSEQPIIEVNGKLQFSLPGQPLFPAANSSMRSSRPSRTASSASREI
jgi:hypothetical protein